MSIIRRHVRAGELTPDLLHADILKERYFFENFMQEPWCTVKGATTEPGGTSLTENIVDTGRYRFEYYFAGDATDFFVPRLASEGGYNWAVGDALGTGVEINFGGLKDGHPRNHTPSGEDWFFRVLLIVDDASGVDIFVGFRRVAAVAATLTEYSDVAGIRILGASGSTDGTFTVITNLNNAGSTDYTATTTTVTGLEDATAVELEVRSINGKAYFLVNGSMVAGSPTFTYDSGDVMAPVARLLQVTDVAAQIKTLAAEGGPLSYRRDATLLSLAGTTT